MKVELLEKERDCDPPPFTQEEAAEMSVGQSPSTGELYSVKEGLRDPRCPAFILL